MRSVAAILAIAHLTLYESRRRRIVTAALLCGVAFLAVYSTAMFLAYREMLQDSPPPPFLQRQVILAVMTMAGLYASNVLMVLFAVLLPVDALSGEIDSGVMQTLASKPIRRADILIGKWLGHGSIVAGYLLLLVAGVLLTARLILGHVPVNIFPAIFLMLFEAILLVTVTIAGGTRLSTVTNGVMVLGFYGIAFVGGWVEQVGGFAGIESARTIGVVASLISPADALWRLGAHHLQPAAVRSAGTDLFAAASVPTWLTVWWAAGFTALTLAWAVRSFNRRAL